MCKNVVLFIFILEKLFIYLSGFIITVKHPHKNEGYEGYKKRLLYFLEVLLRNRGPKFSKSKSKQINQEY